MNAAACSPGTITCGSPRGLRATRACLRQRERGSAESLPAPTTGRSDAEARRRPPGHSGAADRVSLLQPDAACTQAAGSAGAGPPARDRSVPRVPSGCNARKNMPPSSPDPASARADASHRPNQVPAEPRPCGSHAGPLPGHLPAVDAVILSVRLPDRASCATFSRPGLHAAGGVQPAARRPGRQSGDVRSSGRKSPTRSGVRRASHRGDAGTQGGRHAVGRRPGSAALPGESGGMSGWTPCGALRRRLRDRQPQPAVQGFTLPLSSCNAGLNGTSGGGRGRAGCSFTSGSAG